MKHQPLKKQVYASLLILSAFLNVNSSSAQDTVIDTSVLDRISGQSAELFALGAEMQVQINQLSDAASELSYEYKDQAKIVDGLEIYNAGMRRTIAEQERTIAEYDQSIAEAAELQRQISPLMERMMASLEQFVSLDIPFQIEERQERLDTIRGTFDDSSVNVAEKFRLVLQAYQIENDYGRGIAHYTDTLEISGIERDVDLLRVGRIALLYQTSAQDFTGTWDKSTKQWLALDDDYRRPVALGIRMAQQLETTQLLDLPISAPE
tara:strand:+ start:89 stop:883 length:795 start_codon:yes stop_codon:yes gene_type:complete